MHFTSRVFVQYCLLFLGGGETRFWFVGAVAAADGIDGAFGVAGIAFAGKHSLLVEALCRGERAAPGGKLPAEGAVGGVDGVKALIVRSEKHHLLIDAHCRAGRAAPDSILPALGPVGGVEGVEVLVSRPSVHCLLVRAERRAGLHFAPGMKRPAEGAIRSVDGAKVSVAPDNHHLIVRAHHRAGVHAAPGGILPAESPVSGVDGVEVGVVRPNDTVFSSMLTAGLDCTLFKVANFQRRVPSAVLM